jgi:hypothetical protein
VLAASDIFQSGLEETFKMEGTLGVVIFKLPDGHAFTAVMMDP